MKLLIGIDNTDNRTTRSTGFTGRHLAALIRAEKLGIVHGVTRHQLLRDEQIIYTNDNSAICIEVSSPSSDELWEFCKNCIADARVPDAISGICMVDADSVPSEIIEWGKSTKIKFIEEALVIPLVEKHHIQWASYNNDTNGLIGALAAVGLRASGNDGRFIFIDDKDLHKIVGFFMVSELMSDFEIGKILTLAGDIVDRDAVIEVGHWFRPILTNNEKVLFVEKQPQHISSGYRTVALDKLAGLNLNP